MWALAVHGGVDPRAVTPYTRDESERRWAALSAALHAGQDHLAHGGSSLDAVQAAVRVLEDAPDFNAARGATLTHEGYAELDAAIMDARGRRAGAVAGLRRVKNPINVARAVLERSAHVFLVGQGAERFAMERGLEEVDPKYFVTERQVEQLRQALAREGRPLPSEMSGTVGAVALDRQGGLAAATSTGGMTNKRYGRVGDSPVIGACVYAEDGLCAISTTGWGEYFIRTVAAHEVCARIKYGGHSMESAAAQVLAVVADMGGYGGMIAVDAQGKVAAPHSTPRMAHGYVRADEPAVVVLND